MNLAKKSAIIREVLEFVDLEGNKGGQNLQNTIGKCLLCIQWNSIFDTKIGQRGLRNRNRYNRKTNKKIVADHLIIYYNNMSMDEYIQKDRSSKWCSIFV